MARTDGVFAIALASPFVFVVVTLLAIPANWKPSSLLLSIVPLIVGMRLLVGGVRAVLHPQAAHQRSVLHSLVRWLPRLHVAVLLVAVSTPMIDQANTKALDLAWKLAVPVNGLLLFAEIIVALCWLGTPRKEHPRDPAVTIAPSAAS